MGNIMKPALIILFILISPFLYAQNKVRLPIWTFNTDSTTIYGVAVGYVHTDEIDHVITNGVRLEALGLGIGLLFGPSYPIVDSDSLYNAVIQARVSERINGINISPLGNGCDCSVNGINVYGIGSMITRSNGISLALILNASQRHNGIQVAGANQTYKFNGLQIGASNKNNSLRGIQLGLLSNENDKQTVGLQVAIFENRTANLKWLQIGVYNKANKVKGLQLGLWNENDKRKLPLINW